MARGRAWRTLLVALVSVLMLSCQRQDDGWQAGDGAETTNQTETSHGEFALVSVESSGKGRVVELNLALDIDEDQLRALQYSEDNATGALAGYEIPEEEKALMILRKVGDPAATTYVEVKWRQRSSTSVQLEKMTVPLATETITSADQWYISFILGGTSYDRTTGAVTMGSSTAEELPTSGLVEMPYSTAWARLVLTEAEGKISGKLPESGSKLTFRPMGALLRLQYYNDMLESYTAERLTISTNAWRHRGTFSNMGYEDAALEGQYPVWTPMAEGSGGTSPQVASWSYTFGTEAGSTSQALTLPAGAGWSVDRTVWVWGMPTGVADASTDTAIDMDVRPATQPTASVRSARTYSKKGHRALKSGRTYRLSNILTSEPIISEIYYQYVPRSINADQPTANRNYSIVEIYNPTASPVDLSRYALARLVPESATGRNLFFTSGGTNTPDPAIAAPVPLITVTGSASAIAGFSANRTSYPEPWYKSIYGTPEATLAPGRTLLIGAGGYIHTTNLPSKNIDLFTAQLSLEGIYTGTQTIRELERLDYPRAGMQADSAVRAGFAQAMVAIDNSSNKDRDPNPYGVGGVLQLGNGHGIALLRSTVQSDGTYRVEVVDTSVPLGNATSATSYRSELLQQIKASSDYAPASLDHNATMSYSVVRASGVNFPTAEHQPTEWIVSANENDGIKSIGTRDYVAGLTPFGRNYSGYDVANNPKRNPFWGSKRFVPIVKGWADVPETGQNVFNLGVSEVEGEYVLVPVASATASEEQAAYPIGSSYDGRYDTFYHSRNRGDSPQFPIILTYHLEEAQTLSHIIYYPRDQNGSINAYELEVTYEDNSKETVLNTSLGSPTVATRITWPGIEDRKIKTVVFKVKSTYYGVLAVREMEFHRRSDNYFDSSRLFADLACTELKAGVTLEEINAEPNVFFREMARRMLQGTYPREFRIADYEAYPTSDLQREVNKTQFRYSMFDNPTGIVATAGEELVVLVGETRGFPLTMRVQNPENGFGGDSYELSPGLNKIRISRSGLVYIMYNVPQIEINRTTYPDIRVHFANGTGKVNGYYDVQDPKLSERWSELLSKATYTAFDVLGEHSHLIFPTSSFRQNTPSGKILIGLYDKVVRSEMELQGLVKYGRAFRNRMLFYVSYGGYMYATPYYTGYHHSTMNTLTTPSVFVEWPWGVAHEVGHMNQTVGLNWGGLIEISNNIQSLYVEESVFGNPSRSIRNDWYTTAWNALYRTNKTLTTESKANNSLIPFWQLELYFGNVLGRTPQLQSDKGGFFPDLYELLRTTNIPNNLSDPVQNGDQQVNMAYYASKVAGMDLTHFFEQWGFFRLADNEEHRNTYDNAFRITVTQDKVDAVKARIRDLGLTPPPMALEYITSLNWRMFETLRPIAIGTASRSGRVMTMFGWSNVVAWEVVDASGRLLYTSTGRISAEATSDTFTIDFDWVSGYQVRAIAADGSRIVVSQIQ